MKTVSTLFPTSIDNLLLEINAKKRISYLKLLK